MIRVISKDALLSNIISGKIAYEIYACKLKSDA